MEQGQQEQIAADAYVRLPDPSFIQIPGLSTHLNHTPRTGLGSSLSALDDCPEN